MVYHDNYSGSIFDENQNNWDASKDYGKEYANVYFRIDCKYYGYPKFYFENQDNKSQFYNEVKSALYPLGWREENGKEEWIGDNWASVTIVKGGQHLYLHPQEFSGEVLKNDVKAIAEALQGYNTFKIELVDLYETVYDISDSEYEKYLQTKDTEIKKFVFDMCHTTRTKLFYSTYDVLRNVAMNIQLKRLNIRNESQGYLTQTSEHINKVIEEMIADGYIVLGHSDGMKCIRSINKTEQKALKLCANF